MKRLVCLLLCLTLFGARAIAEPVYATGLLYVPIAKEHVLRAVDAEFEETPQGIIDGLIGGGALPSGVKVLSFDQDAGRLDLSEAFGQAVNQAENGETLVMGAVVNSFLNQYALRALTVTSEGEAIKTAHATYDQPLTRFDAQEYTIMLSLSNVQEPEIMVGACGHNFSYASAQNARDKERREDKVRWDAEGMFENLAVMHSPIYTLDLESTVHFSFRDTPADSATLQDYVLNRDGSVKYSVKIDPVPVALKDGEGDFVLKPNLAAALSSDSADYLPGAVLRGFLLTCAWGEDRYQYAFMLRTDAMAASAANGDGK